jgi:protease-4
MSKKTVGVLVVVIVLLVVVVALAGLVGIAMWMSGPDVSEQTVLELDLETSLIEWPPADPVGQLFLRDSTKLIDVVESLDRAAEDDRIAGVVAKIGAAPMGMATVQELRDAIARFRSRDKFAIAWSETFGEVGAGNNAYYLATAFDEIYLVPSGDVGLTGMHYQSQFLNGLLEKVEAQPRMDHRKEYKNAMNTFTEQSYTESHREAMKHLADSHYGQLVRAIAEARGLYENEVRGLIDRGPYLGQEAVDAGLVDGLAYRDEVYAKAKERAGENSELLYLHAYRNRTGWRHDDGEVVALIFGTGTVMRGGSSFDPLTGGFSMGSDTVSKAFRAAVEDDDVEAILFRVDSPGGSYVASDVIWRESHRAQEAGKPVVVSMGNVAASGGYFVAMNANKIVAHPGTITGSIGVLGGKILVRDTYNKVGITFDGVKTAENATMYSALHDYTDYGWSRHQAWLDRVYEDFTSKVAEGRELPLQKVRQVAKGRIWTGEAAQERGLVDALGGFDVALRVVREEAGLPADAEIELRVYPRPKTPYEAFFGEPPESSEARAAAQAAARLIEAVRPIGEVIDRLEQKPGEQTLKAPEIQTGQ